MEPAFLGLAVDSSIVIDAERKHQTIEDLLTAIRQRFGEVEIVISALTVAELVHGVERAQTPEIRQRRRPFIDELKKHVPVQPVTDESGELAGTISGRLAAKGINVQVDDLLIGVAALEQGYAVATLNRRHYEKIPGLIVVSL
jgi:predicted nucleic acid-binding protein